MYASPAQSNIGALFSDIAFDEAAMRHLVGHIGAASGLFAGLAAAGLQAPAARCARARSN